MGSSHRTLTVGSTVCTRAPTIPRRRHSESETIGGRTSSQPAQEVARRILGHVADGQAERLLGSVVLARRSCVANRVPDHLFEHGNLLRARQVSRGDPDHVREGVAPVLTRDFPTAGRRDVQPHHHRVAEVPSLSLGGGMRTHFGSVAIHAARGNGQSGIGLLTRIPVFAPPEQLVAVQTSGGPRAAPDPVGGSNRPQRFVTVPEAPRKRRHGRMWRRGQELRQGFRPASDSAPVGRPRFGSAEGQRYERREEQAVGQHETVRADSIPERTSAARLAGRFPRPGDRTAARV